LAKRLFDIIAACIGLIVFSPVFIFVALAIYFDDGGAVFFKQERVGLNKRIFEVIKFRTMKVLQHQGLNITVGNNDQRITKLGGILRRYKIDELPQLINVLKGEMSFVGPRPEVPRYVSLYNLEQQEVFRVKPGITDFASIEFRNENELLASVPNPEKYYIEEIMPIKLSLNIKYIKNQSLFLDIKLIIKTVIFIFVKS
jgi:lipopolysaccharide/colanic/teichoic acid biosynthesis glycosyltransferase